METVVNVGQLTYGQPTFHYYYSEGRFPSHCGDPASSLFAQPSGSIWKNTSVQHLAPQRARRQTGLKQDTCVHSNFPLLYTSPNVSCKTQNCSVSGSCSTCLAYFRRISCIFLKSFLTHFGVSKILQHQTKKEPQRVTLLCKVCQMLSDCLVSLGKCSTGFKCTY